MDNRDLQQTTEIYFRLFVEEGTAGVLEKVEILAGEKGRRGGGAAGVLQVSGGGVASGEHNRGERRWGSCGRGRRGRLYNGS